MSSAALTLLSGRHVVGGLGALIAGLVLAAAALIAWRLDQPEDSAGIERLRMQAEGGRDAQALLALRQRAARGEPLAQRSLGSLLWRQALQTRDANTANEAVRWLSAAADRGDAASQRTLGQLYRNGLPGVPQDLPRARRLYIAAAQQDDTAAAHALGLMLRSGAGGAVDLAQARYWWQRAAAAGDADAMYMLGNVYAYGEGTKPDGTAALAWYAQAAALEQPQALQELAMIYREGRLGQAPDAQRANEAVLELQHALQHHRD